MRNKMTLMVFFSDGRSKSIPFNLAALVRVSLGMIAVLIVCSLGLTGYNTFTLAMIRKEHERCLKIAATEKDNTLKSLKRLENFEEKISLYLGGALTDREGVRTGLDKVSYAGGIGGGDDSESSGPEDIDIPAAPEFNGTAPEERLDSSNTELRLWTLRERLNELASLAQKEKDRLDLYPSTLPAAGYITSRFGWRRSPFTGTRQVHRGIDVVNKIGTPVRATAAGWVIFAGKEEYWGNAVFIEHQKGVVTKYGHMSMLNVKTGDKVTRGQLIGHIGMTGRTTGPHVHYQIEIDEQAVNPMLLIIDETEFN